MQLRNQSLLQEIERKSIIQSKPKGSILLNEGEHSTRLIFLLEGLACGFYYKDDQEVTSWILPEGNFLFSPSSFLGENPVNETIQLLENAKILIMKIKDLESLQLIYPEAALLTIKILSKFLNDYDRRVRFLRLSAEERLKNYETEYPKIVHRLSITQLATFLGLSKSSISHIRAKK